ncbi:MAG: dihydrolipoyl dehydrogenase [Planctomycetota bacterium]
MASYDLIVIGAGPGGYVAAIRAAQLGMNVALIEKGATLGGTCLNVGCIPSKALLISSEYYHLARHAYADHGIKVGSVELDLPQMIARKAKVVTEITNGLSVLMKKNKVKTFRGRGSLSGKNKVLIEGAKESKEIEGTHILLAMGSVPIELPGLPFDGERIVSSTEVLSMEKLPESMIVVGAGAIGLEMGSVWNRLGTRVTVVELLPMVAPFADKQMSTMLKRSLNEQGMTFKMSSRVTEAKMKGGQLAVTLETDNGKTEEMICEKLLVAVGRKPCTEGTGLKKAGVLLDNKGRVNVDEQWRTNVPGVYAIGDLIAGPMLAHKAEDEGVALAELLAGKAGHINYDIIPNVIYTAPELAQVGLTEEQLKEQNIPYKSGRSYFRTNGRAKSMGEEDGLVKVLAHKETDRILGVHILGPRASDLIAEAVAFMEFSGSAEDLARTCHAHPTLPEVLKEAAMAVDRWSIHG